MSATVSRETPVPPAVAARRAQLVAAADALRSVPEGQDAERALYTAWFSRGCAPDGHLATLPAPWSGRRGDAPFARLLGAAHADARAWERARVARVAGPAVVVRPDGGPSRAALLPDCAHAGPGAAPGLAVGDDVVVRVRRTAPPSEGWWRTWGPGWNVAAPPVGTTRLYLATDPAPVLDLVRAVTEVVRGTSAPWMLKVVADPDGLDRADAVVLYVAAPLDAVARSDRTARLLAALRGTQRPAVPPLTLPLDDGVGLAQDPDDGRSFGQVVCSWVASAVLSTAPGTDPADLDAALAQALRAEGRDPDEPWRSPAADAPGGAR